MNKQINNYRNMYWHVIKEHSIIVYQFLQKMIMGQGKAGVYIVFRGFVCPSVHIRNVNFGLFLTIKTLFY
jgi:hypothetical protein